MAHGLAAAHGARPGGRAAAGADRAADAPATLPMEEVAPSGGKARAGTAGMTCLDGAGGRSGGPAQGRNGSRAPCPAPRHRDRMQPRSRRSGPSIRGCRRWRRPRWR